MKTNSQIDFLKKQTQISIKKVISKVYEDSPDITFTDLLNKYEKNMTKQYLKNICTELVSEGTIPENSALGSSLPQD